MALRTSVVALIAWLPALAAAAALSGAEDLTSQYYNIFKTGNRNAASHLWASYILDQSSELPADTLTSVFHGFCPVSGSPLPDRPDTMYKVTLPSVDGGRVTGVSRHCCWPCICDMNELVRVDTKTVKTATGPQEYKFLVIGDPCVKPELLSKNFVDPFSNVSTPLSEAAPEVVCEDGKLKGATFSDNGHPIIGMLFMNEQDDVEEVPHQADDPTYGFAEMCLARKKSGYNSGMGLIFHLVANISPISVADQPTLPPMGAAFTESLQEKVALRSGERVPKVFAEAKPCVHAEVASKLTPRNVTLGLSVGLAVVTAVALAADRVLRSRRLKPKQVDEELTVAE